MTPGDARKRLAALPAIAAAALAPALDRVAETVAAEARRQLGMGHGPGTPPADPSGALAAAISTGRDSEGRATVTVAASFAADLEFGTVRAAARPFLRPAVATTSDAARQILREALQPAIARDAP